MGGVYEEVGRHIRQRRQALGLTLEGLEERSGVSASYIGRIERDASKTSLLTLARLARALGVRVGKLFDLEGPVGALPWGRRIESLLDLYSAKERRILLSVLEHLARELRRARR